MDRTQKPVKVYCVLDKTLIELSRFRATPASCGFSISTSKGDR